jgi:hypothetical protein
MVSVFIVIVVFMLIFSAPEPTPPPYDTCICSKQVDDKPLKWSMEE